MNINSKKIDIKLVIVLLLLIVSIVMVSIYNIKINSKEDLKKYINIDELSEEFMDNYFAEVSRISMEGKDENIILILSETKPENTYGAINIVEAPNNQYILEYNTKEEANSALEQLQNDDSIISVETNTQYEFDSIEYNSWGVEKAHYDYAIEEINKLGLEEVKVAILDNGIDIEKANELYPNKMLECYNTFNESKTDIDDDYGHGVYVFSIIAESTPENVKIIPIKIGKGASVYSANILSAINYIIYNNVADVVNMSFGGYPSETPTAINLAIQSANEKGIIFVASAGNNNTDKYHTPSDLENVISTGAVDENLERWINQKTGYGSNYSQNLDFVSAGSKVKSYWNNGNKNNWEIKSASGTSAASPHIAAAVAILKSFNKNLTHDEVVELLKEHVIDLGEEGWDQYYGYGFVTFENTIFCNGTNCPIEEIFYKGTVGDVNDDNKVDENDETSLLEYLSDETKSINNINANLDNDEIIDYADYQILRSYNQKIINNPIYTNKTKYKVTLNLNGGNITTNVNAYYKNLSEIKVDNPTKEGYVFNGWINDNEENTQKDLIIGTDSEGDLYYSASWTLNEEENNGLSGDANEDKTVNVIDANLIMNYILGKDVTINKKLSDIDNDGNIDYADYQIVKAYSGKIIKKLPYNSSIKYTVNLNLNGGTIELPINSYYSGISEIQIENPTKDGYVFGGWTGSNGDTPQKNIKISKNSKSNLEYNALWIKYGDVNNDGNVNIIDANMILRYLLKQASSINMYNADVDCDGIIDYADYQILKAYVSKTIDNIPYTGKTKYTITINTNGGIITTPISSYYSGISDIILETPTRDGYEFTGWTGSNGNTLEKNVTISKNTTGNLTYKAGWKATESVSNKILGDTNNDGKINVIDSNTLLLYLNDRSVSINTYNSDIDEDGDIDYLDYIALRGYIVKNINELPYKNQTKYTITYNLDGGTLETLKNEYYPNLTSIVLDEPTKEGYVFAGWTGSNGETPTTNLQISQTTTGNLTYTANWIMYGDLNNDGNVNVIDVSIMRKYLVGQNSNINTKVADVDCDGVVDSADHQILTAKASNVITTLPYQNHQKYKIELETELGEISYPLTAYYSGLVDIKIDNLSKYEYIFVGWTGSNGTTPQKDYVISKDTTGNLKYTANWNIDESLLDFD